MANSSYTVEAVLKARDSGFSNAMRAAERSVAGLSNMASKVGSTFKSVLGANLISSALTSGIGSITSGIGSMVGELNGAQKAWKTFEGNLQAFGRSAETISQAKKEMQDFATKTIYSASDMASTYSQLDAVGTKNVGSLVKAFGGLAASAENPAQAMKSLSTQATQMASKPKVAWMDFKIMMEQAPAGMAAVAKEMGMSTAELVSAVQNGKVNTEEFFDALNKAGNSDAFQKMATEFKTVDQAIDGMKESLSNKLMPVFEQLNKFGIKAVNALSDAFDKIDFNSIASKLETGIPQAVAKIKYAMKTVFNNKTTQAFSWALYSVKAAVESVVNAFNAGSGSTGWLLLARNAMKTFANVAAAGAQWVKQFVDSFVETGAIASFKAAMNAIFEAVQKVVSEVSKSQVFSTFGSVIGSIVNVVSQAATAVAKFISSLKPEQLQLITKIVAGAAAGFLAFGASTAVVGKGIQALNFLKSFNPFALFRRNAESGVAGASSAVTSGISKIAQIIKSMGGAIKSAAVGIGVGIKAALGGVSQVIMAFGVALKTAGVANILALGAAVGIAAVGIGAGVAIIAAGFALLATQSQGISAIIGAVGQAFSAFATAIIGAFAQAIVTVAGVLPTVTSALAGLSPLVVAVGTAVGQAAPFVTALGEAFTSIISVLPPVITALSEGAAAIISALTPIVEIVGNVFTNIAQIVADAIVKIVQALAPFMPAVSEMVQALAPVLQSIVEAFTTLVSQISPIINSIANLFTSLGNAIKTVLDGAKGVIEGFGNAVKSILDGISGIFDAIGRAALNAGKGFKLLAEGVVMITNTKLGDLASSLAAAAAGVTAIAGAAAGLGNAGNQIKSLGQGLIMIQSSGAGASSALSVVSSAIPSLSSSLTNLAPNLKTAANSLRSFSTTATTSATGFALIAQSLATIPMQLAMIATSATAATSSMAALAAAVPTVSAGLSTIGASAQVAMAGLISAITSAMTKAVTSVQSGMLVIVTIIRSSAIQMTQAGQQAGQGVSRGVVNGIRSGVAGATAAMNSLMLSVQHVGNIGARNMVNVGTQIGNGLARGMIAALPAVTSAANALVAQAERAARSAADIHSPSRLFRDRVGIFIGQGIAVGIDRSQKFVNEALENLYDVTGKFDYSSLLDDSLRSQGYSASLNGSLSLESKQEDRKLDIIKDALNTIKQSLDREVVLNVNGQEFARLTGDDFSRYQSDREYINNILKGVRV